MPRYLVNGKDIGDLGQEEAAILATLVGQVVLVAPVAQGAQAREVPAAQGGQGAQAREVLAAQGGQGVLAREFIMVV